MISEQFQTNFIKLGRKMRIATALARKTANNEGSFNVKDVSK
jgi:hypothetical protein